MDGSIGTITPARTKASRAKPPLTETAATMGIAAIDKSVRSVVITPPKFETATVVVVGDSPLVIHAFSQKAQEQIRATQEAGHQTTKGKKREPKSFEAAYNNARYIAQAGWDGIPASAFRSAMISACRTVGFKMTIAKMSLFCIADGYDNRGTPLVKITKGSPTMHVGPARNANGGMDLRARPMWEPGWEAKVTLRWDAEQFSANDIINLLARAGGQVGLCEGRPDSRMSAGCGWGTFIVAE